MLKEDVRLWVEKVKVGRQESFQPQIPLYLENDPWIPGPIQGDAVSCITTNQHGIPYIPVVFKNINNSNTFGFRNNSEMQLSIKKVQILGN